MSGNEWPLPETMLGALSQSVLCTGRYYERDNVLIWQAYTQVCFGLFAVVFSHKIKGTMVFEGGRNSLQTETICHSVP